MREKKILIVSDTHGRCENLERVLLIESPIDMMIHCGDLEGDEDYFEALADAPCYMVSGNNDFFSDLPREEGLILGNKRVLITHGHYYGVSLGIEGILDEAHARGVQIVCFGHTHRPVVYEDDGVTAVNPGSLSYPRQIGRKPSYIILNINSKGEFSFEIKFLGR